MLVYPKFEVTNDTFIFDDAFIETVKKDFKICWISREMSLLGRKDVLTGKAKFGIFGDGKEVAQVAMAHTFQRGDWRSGYYRDQTFMLAVGLLSVESFFSQMYADSENDPFSGGRQMNAHFASPTIDKDGKWIDATKLYNTSSDISSTAGQMPRAMGLAFASKLYRTNPQLATVNQFSDHGNEVCFCTIGDASTSEGVFWEVLNAAGVKQVPLAISVWDDGYGISVPVEYQTTKGSISEVLEGFQPTKNKKGVDIYPVKGWDYLQLRKAYTVGIEKVRTKHAPAVFHIQELTQPQGHSTSGSHERYKSEKRLNWEKNHDCLLKMEQWMLKEGLITKEEVTTIKEEARFFVREQRDKAWKAYSSPLQAKVEELKQIFQEIESQVPEQEKIKYARKRREIEQLNNPVKSELVQHARRAYFELAGSSITGYNKLLNWLSETYKTAHQDYHTYLYSDSESSARKVKEVKPIFSSHSPSKNGYQILNAYFDKILAKNSLVLAFGEDVGTIGDVNQGLAGLQEKYGTSRVFDTGIRELSIMGKAIGLAMRGLRPIAEIQYLDYLIYGLQPLADDLACLRYRTDNLQQAPVIIRTRGHRLEGIWHSGSPIGMIINALRGIYLIVPRDMVQAAGFYNTMLQSDDPAIIIECLNGYRLKEKQPDNLGEYTIPLGRPEVLIAGTDITVVTYGTCVRVAQEAIITLNKMGVSVELIDVQTLIPFDVEHIILKSLQKTNAVLFLDEDMPGGATAYMMQQVLELQNGYQYLDAKPITVTSKEHRPPYGSDGDYFTKPNPEDIVQAVYNLVHERMPKRFPVALIDFYL